jgi:hypothetical protein
MPGAGNFDAVELAFTQRPADMRTVVIDGVKRAGYIEEGDFLTGCFDQFGLARSDLTEAGNFHKLWHLRLLTFKNLMCRWRLVLI